MIWYAKWNISVYTKTKLKNYTIRKKYIAKTCNEKILTSLEAIAAFDIFIAILGGAILPWFID